MKNPGFCTATSVWGWKLVCVQESGLFTYIAHSTQVDTNRHRELGWSYYRPAITGVTGQNVPPAGLYPRLTRPRLDYTRYIMT